MNLLRKAYGDFRFNLDEKDFAILREIIQRDEKEKRMPRLIDRGVSFEILDEYMVLLIQAHLTQL